jgi:hypothetical protein
MRNRRILTPTSHEEIKQYFSNNQYALDKSMKHHISIKQLENNILTCESGFTSNHF